MRRLFGTLASAVVLLALASALPRLDSQSTGWKSLWAQPPPDNYEPNDWWTNAVELAPGIYRSYISHNRDLDWFRVYVPEPGSEILASITHLPADYDLALLSDPMQLELDGWKTVPMADLAEIDVTGRLTSGGDISDLIAIEPVGALRAISTSRGTTPEEVRTNTFDTPGWYYLLVRGYNGAYDSSPYTLRIQVIPPPPSSRACSAEPPLHPGIGAPRWQAGEAPQTLILLNKQRFDAFYGTAQTEAMLAELRRLAAHPLVRGLIEPVENDPDVAVAYAAWGADACDPRAANRVTEAIKALVDRLWQEFPSLRQLVIVGGDPIIPFRRVPDPTRLGSEHTYADQFSGDPQSPLVAALVRHMVLTDDFYVSQRVSSWQGRVLFIPQRPIGRLVEAPTEITNFIRAFLDAGGQLQLTTAFVLGAAPGLEVSRQTAATLRGSGLLTDALIGDAWDATELRRQLLNRHHDLNVLFASTTHNRIYAPVAVGDPVSAEEMTEVGSELANALVIAGGSHLGLNIPDLWTESQKRLDFAQVFADLGTTLVANTGYAYGGTHLGNLSDALMLRFLDALLRSPGTSVGDALLHAKQTLLDEVGPTGLGAYQEKSLLQATLYGLPMLRITLSDAQHRQRFVASGRASPTPRGTAAAKSRFERAVPTVERVEVRPRFRPTDTAEGTYFAAEGGLATWPGRPIQPRVVVPLPDSEGTPHGVLLTAARFRDIYGFDPLIAPVAVTGGANEPPYLFAAWWPRRVAAIDRLPLGEGVGRLVVIPAQYRKPRVERIYERLTFEVYFSASEDYRPPVIWEVGFIDTPQGADFNVWASDASGIWRVVVTYTRGDGGWRSIELQDVEMGTHWFAFVPRLDGNDLEFFVQAVDGAGNVAVHTDKGRFFRQSVEYLPAIQR